MLRLSLALVCVTTTASAAMPFELPPLAIPSPTISEMRPLHYSRGNAAGRAFTYRPIVSYCAGGLILTPAYPYGVTGLIELFGSEARYRNALECTRVEVVRLSRRLADSDKPADYTEGEVITLRGWQSEIIQHTLIADSSYNWEPPVEVIELADLTPLYDLRIRLYYGEKAITADLSLSAQTIRIHENFGIVAEQPLSERGFGLLLFLDRPQR